MKKIIHSIRNKPDHIKTRLVIIFAVLATAIVVTVWVMTLQLLKTPDDTIKTDGPFKVFRQVFKSNVSTIKEETKSDRNPLDLLKPENQTDSAVVESSVSSDSGAIMDDSGDGATTQVQADQTEN